MKFLLSAKTEGDNLANNITKEQLAIPKTLSLIAQGATLQDMYRGDIYTAHGNQIISSFNSVEHTGCSNSDVMRKERKIRSLL